MRHEELNVGKLVVESGVYDENGNAIITDSATNSSADSQATSRAVSTNLSVSTKVASAVTAGSTVSAAVSAHGQALDSLVMSAGLSDTTSYNTVRVAYNSSVLSNTSSIASLLAYDSSVATGSTTQSTDDLAISIFNSATISDGRAASGVSAMISAGADSYLTSMLSVLVSRVSAAANSNPM